MAAPIIGEEEEEFSFGGTPIGGFQERAREGILNELVKSYGIKQDKVSGDWGWSLENVADSFEESPVWTTIDWVTLAMPVTKWGSAAAKVVRGGGAVGKAYKAGEFAGKTARTRFGRGLGSVVGDDFAAAVSAQGRAPGGSKLRQRFTNFAGQRVDDEYLDLAVKYGADPGEKRGIFRAMETERIAESGYWARKGEDILRKTNNLDDAARAKIGRFLEHPLADPEKHGDALRRYLGSDDAFDAYRKSWSFRNEVHERAHDLKLISDKTYETNLKRYSPRMYDEYIRLRQLERKRIKAGGGGTRGSAGVDRFRPRGFEDETLTKVFDANVSVYELAKAGETIAYQGYFQKLAGSLIARGSDEVADLVRRAATGDDVLAKANGYTDEMLEEARLVLQRAGGATAGEVDEKLARIVGWSTLDAKFAAVGGKVPGYIDRLPEELLGRVVDPAVADDVQALAKASASHTGLMADIHKLYQRSLSYFRASKTAYNPATHTRNWVGASVFHHLATGRAPTLMPRKGWAAYKKGLDSDDVLEAMHAGVLGSSFDKEIKDALVKAVGEIGPDATAIDFLGNSKVANLLQGLAGKAERTYRATDEIWKFDAFITLRDRYVKSGLSRSDALAEATLQVNKYFPNFAQHSEFTDMIRGAIPFASFTTEAVRIWKNAMVDKPHLAFFWTHMADMMSHTFGAMGGFEPGEVEAAREALPYYMQDKKTTLMPFRVDGKPTFLDMSYLIPMANISEAATAEASFFDMLQIDPTANPVVSMLVAASTGTDPFSGRDIEPQFTERQLGVPVQGERKRMVIGLLEHGLRLAAPPLAPPGYAGVNLLEYARGQKHGATGEPLEPGILRSVLANVMGLRTYEADVNSQLLNAKKEQRVLSKRMTQWWDRWKNATANGDVGRQEAAAENIVALRNMISGTGDGEEYLAKGTYRREIGKFRGVSSRHLKETLDRSGKIGTYSDADQKMLTELRARQWERR